MQQNTEQALRPVTHYELLGVEPTASIDTIRARYNILNKFWHINNSKHWMQAEDLEHRAIIFARLADALMTLMTKREAYDSLLKDSNQMITTEEEAFRSIWEKMKIKYHHKLSDFKFIQPVTEQKPYQRQWTQGKLEHNLLIELFKYIDRKTRSKIARVSKETEAIINQLEFQEYCDLVNQQVKKTYGSLTQENTLTIPRLKEGWQFGDRTLRMLITLRFNARDQQSLSSWYESLLVTLEDPTQNKYLKNPYLRDLVLLLLITKRQLQRAAALIRIEQLDVSKLHDPSAICLYALALGPARVRKALWDYLHSALGMSQTSAPLQLLIEGGQQQTGLLYTYYLYPERTTSYIKKIANVDPKQYPDLQLTPHNINAFWTEAQCFIGLSSAVTRTWLLQTDPDLFSEILLEFFVYFFKDGYNLSFWEDLTNQLRQMTPPEMRQYLSAFLLNGVQKYEEGELYKKRLRSQCEEFTKLPVETIRSKLAELKSFSKEYHGPVLRLLLNTRLNFITGALLSNIFFGKISYSKKNNEVVNMLEVLATCLDETCINYITNPANKLGAHDESSLVTFLKQTSDKYIYLCLFALKRLCDVGLSSLLSNGLLTLFDLIRLSKSDQTKLLQMILLLPQQELERALIDKILSCLTNLPTIDQCKAFLEKNNVKVTSSKDLFWFILIPHSGAILTSNHLTLLLRRIGLENFIYCNTILINYIPVLSYVESVFTNAKEKFDGLLKIIEEAFQQNAKEQLPQLISAYLFTPAPAEQTPAPVTEFFKPSGKRTEKAEANGSPLKKLYCSAKEDPELAQRLLDEGERYSHCKQ